MHARVNVARHWLFGLVVMAVLIAWPMTVRPTVVAADTITKTNTVDAVVDDNAPATLTIVVTTADVPAGSTIEDVVVSLTFSRIDSPSGGNCSTPGSSAASPDEMVYSLTSPSGTRVVLIESSENTGGSGAPATYNIASGSTPELTVVFDDDATEPVRETPPSGPRSGTFRPVQPLSGFDGENPLGTWSLFIGDSFMEDVTCHREFSLTLDYDVPVPEVTLTSPVDGAEYALGQVVTASYSCTADEVAVATCEGTVPNGSPIDTSTPGEKTFTVTGTNTAGGSTTTTVSYTVVYEAYDVRSVSPISTGSWRVETYEQSLSMNQVHQLCRDLGFDRAIGIARVNYRRDGDGMAPSGKYDVVTCRGDQGSAR